MKTLGKMSTIYILEDEVDLAEMLAMELENQRYEVQTFYNPKSFLEYVTHHTPDLVITDIRLPEISGKEIITLLKKANPLYPSIIVMTAYEDFPIYVLYQLGAEAVLSKPFELSQINSLVERLLLPYEKRFLKEVFSHQDIQWLYELTENDMDEIVVGRGGFSFISSLHLGVGEQIHFRFHFSTKNYMIMEGLGIIRWAIPSFQTGTLNKYGVEIVYLYDTIKYVDWVREKGIIPYIPYSD